MAADVLVRQGIGSFYFSFRIKGLVKNEKEKKQVAADVRV